jgi:hypothetical protein
MLSLYHVALQLSLIIPWQRSDNLVATDLILHTNLMYAYMLSL